MGRDPSVLPAGLRGAATLPQRRLSTGEAGAQLCKASRGKRSQRAGAPCGTAERESPLLSPPLFHVSADAISADEVCLSGGKKRGLNQMAGLINCSGKAN